MNASRSGCSYFTMYINAHIFTVGSSSGPYHATCDFIQRFFNHIFLSQPRNSLQLSEVHPLLPRLLHFNFLHSESLERCLCDVNSQNSNIAAMILPRWRRCSSAFWENVLLCCFWPFSGCTIGCAHYFLQDGVQDERTQSENDWCGTCKAVWPLMRQGKKKLN